MNAHPRTALKVPAFIVAVAAIWPAAPVQAHDIDCNGRAGIDLARCMRHQKMAEQCGPLKGDAHLACDREFLIKHPLDCKALAGADAKQCQAEVAAFKTCEPKAGREFVRCVRDEIKASPMGGT